MKSKITVPLLALVLLLAVGAVFFCPRPRPAPGSGDAASADHTADGSATRQVFTIKNECSFDIWIQQQNMPGPEPAVVLVPSRKHTDYDIPVAGLPSTRFWVKTGCDVSGQNCKSGQSSPPCPAAGCAPPVDSKIEATWGCDLDEKACGKTPQGKTLKGPTWWNSSAVDGYTLPYLIEVGSNGGPGCSNVNCNELMQSQCPAAEDLSDDGKYPDLKSVDLNVPGGGCYSTCQVLTQVGHGGKGYQPPSDPHAAMYCCPTPPVSAEACRKGPVSSTKYVKGIHAMCHDSAYAYAYDDGVGLHTCTPTTKITMTYCPPVPAAKK